LKRNNDDSFFKNLKAAYILKAVLRYLIDTILIALILCIVALAIQKLTFWQWSGLWFYPLLIILAAVLAGLYALRLKKGLKDELITLEKELKLEELLSTWYEYRQTDPENPWTAKLETETGNFFKRIPPARAFPGPFIGAHLLIPLLVILGVLLLVMEPQSFREDKLFETSLARLGTRLERVAGRIPPIDRQSEDSRDRELAGEMEKLSRELKSQKLKKEEILRTVQEMKLKIEKDNSLLSRNIREELGVDDFSDKLGSGRETSPERETEKLEQLKETLEEIFQKEVPVSLSRKMESLGHSLELQELLDEIYEEMGSGLATPGPKSSEDGGQEEGLGTSAEQEKDEAFSGQSLVSKDIDETIAQKDPHDLNPSDKHGPGRENGTGTREDLVDVFQAGRGTSAEKSDDPGEFERKPAPILTERHEVEAEDLFNINVKSLPVMQQTQIKAEDVIQNYRRELEAVLDKEEIPISDREAIRNYFISIGLRKESNDRAND